MSAAAVHVVVPDGVDDPRRPSGGNHYDRRVCDGLRAAGWTVHEHPVGSWPSADPATHRRLAEVLASLPDGTTVLVDGLVGSAAPEELAGVATRLRVVLLVHLPLGVQGDDDVRAAERAAIGAAAEVVTTSGWSRSWLVTSYGVGPEQVHVAVPGVEPAPLASGRPDGTGLLCVAAVTPVKGHDLLVAALATVADLPWRCTCVGSLEVDPGFAKEVRGRAGAAGVGDRVRFTGALPAGDVSAEYAGADLLVLASRTETWGMVAVEALARGVPVLGPAVGGLPEAVGRAADGSLPGLLVAPEDPVALGAGLRRWLTGVPERARWRAAARDRRGSLPTWPDTVSAVARVLAPEPAGTGRRRER